MLPQERDATGETILGDTALPIPIQIFLWRQVSPFVRPKLGKLHEASCMFCQHAITGHHELKEACKIFEKVLVQNLFSGLKKDLTEAVKTIPRWRMIQAALPHVMHSVQSVLYNRMKDGNLQSLGAVETKLLYTLHWILLDAADECADADFEKGIFHCSQFHYLFSVPTITLFVYLFAPLCQNLKESDFQNFRLENGLKIWQPMWEFRHPEAQCFISHCKPKPKFFHGKSAKWKTQFGDVFMGRKHSQGDSATTGRDSPTLSQQVSASSSEQQHAFSIIPPTTVTVTATITTKCDDEAGWVSSPKDTVFPETIPEESSSTEEEHVVIFRLPSLHESDGFLRDPSIYTAETSIIQLAMRRNGRTNNINKTLEHTMSSATSTDSKSPRPPMQKIGSSTDKDSVDSGEKKQEHNESGTKFGSHHIMDLTAATFLDVGVLRCLFITHWQEEGIYWALHFLYNRLRDISEETAAQHQPRKRSNSLPIPKIEVSFYQNSENKKVENKDFIEVPEPKDVSLLTESPYTNRKQSDDSLHKRAASEKGRRRMKIADLKAFVETKLLSKSDKALEKIGQDDPKPLDQSQPDYHRSLDTSEEISRKNSGLSKSFEPIPNNLVKGKSMPSLSCLIDEINSEG